MRLPPYPKYKPSGVEWLGDVPEHWAVKAIKWESPVLRGASPRPIDNEIYFDDEGEYAWVRIADVSAAGMYLRDTTQRLSELGQSLSVPLQPGALFLSIAGTVGTPCITAIKCCIHDGFVYFPYWRGDARFLFYLFASGEPYKGLGKLGTQLNLNTDTVGGVVVGVPPDGEQYAIADFLDRETEKIDTLVAKKRTLIERLKEKRAALISRTVTRGLPPDAARLDSRPRLKPSGIDWLGDVPEHWTMKRIGDEFEFISYGFTNPMPTTSEGPRMITANDVVDGRVLLTTARCTDQADFEELTRKSKPRKRDILLTKDGTLGRVSVVTTDEAFCINQSVALLRPKPRTNEVFLALALQSPPYFDRMIFEAGGTTIKHIYITRLARMSFAAPPFPEQAAIATAVRREAAKIDSMVAKVDTAIERLLEYRMAMITAAVTGKLDVRGAAAA